MENILKEKRKIKWKTLGPIKQKKDTIKENHKEDVCQVKKGTRWSEERKRVFIRIRVEERSV